MQQETPLGVPGDEPRDGAGSSSRVVASVQVPDGCPTPKVSVSFEPKTVLEFEAVVDACGGAAKFSTCMDFAFADVEGGRVHLHRPKDREPVVVLDPFMQAFGNRIRIEQAKALEAKACPVPDSEADVPW
jgi:hypothetical protein